MHQFAGVCCTIRCGKGRQEKGRKSISGRDGGVVVALINGTSNQVKGEKLTDILKHVI